MNQHSLACLKPGEVEGDFDGGEDNGHGRQGGGGNVRRRGRYQRFRADYLRAVGFAFDSDHAVANGHTGHVRADGHDPAADLNAGTDCFDGVDDRQNVGKVQPGRLHSDADIIARQRLLRQVRDVHRFNDAAGVGLQTPLGRRGQGEAVGYRVGPHQAGGPSGSQAVSNVGFRVGVQQLVDQGGYGRRRVGGVKVNHARAQMGSFPAQHPAESPQQGAGNLAVAFAFQHLTAPGDEPDGLRRGGVGVHDSLGQGEGAAGGMLGVGGQLVGGSVGAVAVEGGKVNDAVEREVGRQRFQQRAPGFTAGKVHGHSDYFCRLVGVLTASISVWAGQKDGLVAGGELGGQFVGHAAAVAGQNPYAGGFRHVGRAAGEYDAAVRGAGGVAWLRPQHGHVLKSGIGEGALPYLRAGQRVPGAVGVGESPPTVQLSKNQVNPALGAQALEGQERTGWPEQLPAVGECLVKVAGGVEHVGGDYQVVAVRVKALTGGVLLDVQSAIEDCGVAVAMAETGFGFGEEAGGYVGVGVFKASGGEFGQHGGGGRAGAGADFKDADAAAFGEVVQQHGYGVANQAVAGAGGRRFQIQVGGGRVAAAEQQGKRVGAAKEDVGQGVGGTSEDADFVSAVGVFTGHPIRECVGVGGDVVGQRVVLPNLDEE